MINMRTAARWFILAACLACVAARAQAGAAELHPLPYNNPGLVVDLGVGLWAWPLPMDFDGDGDLDLVVSNPDKPNHGTFFFENPGGGASMPVFEPGVRIGPGFSNIRVSHTDAGVRVTTPFTEYSDFLQKRFDAPVDLPVNVSQHRDLHGFGRRIRANQWSYADLNGDGRLDLVVGQGDWTDYGWDNAWDAGGNWTNGPLHGFVYVALNKGGNAAPKYGKPIQIKAGGAPVDVYGMPSPNFADFDGDGDLDLVCGEFLDRLTYFENRGARERPDFAPGRFLEYGGQVIRMDLEMIVPAAIDWDADGDVDLIVGQEDGRVAFVENSGRIEDGAPRFLPPVFFKQRAENVKFGALATPVVFDWDGDGDDDILAGNSAGYIGFIENLGGGAQPVWAGPAYVEAGGETIRIQAGRNGSIQGPAEAKWGYTVIGVADWDGDGLPDILANSIWGKVVWFRNTGTRTAPRLAPAAPVTVKWRGVAPKPAWNWWNPAADELATQWRTTPVPVDWNADGLMDLMMLDHEGYLALYERAPGHGSPVLLDGSRIFIGADGNALQLNSQQAGHSGRRKIAVADWDGDGVPDLLANSQNIEFWKGARGTGRGMDFALQGDVAATVLAGHTTSPAPADWNRDGLPDLLVGAEDGFFYYMENPATRAEPAPLQ